MRKQVEKLIELARARADNFAESDRPNASEKSDAYEEFANVLEAAFEDLQAALMGMD